MEAKVSHKKDRGRPNEDRNRIITRIILGRGKPVNEGKKKLETGENCRDLCAREAISILRHRKVEGV